MMQRIDWSSSNVFSAQVRIVCLCGAARFRSTFEELEGQLTRAGCVVISITTGPGQPHADDPAAPTETGDAGDQLSRHKIELCDAFVVLNMHGFIDEATRRHIRQAQKAGKPIQFVESLGSDRRWPVQAGPPAAWRHPGDLPERVPEGTVLDLTRPFRVHAGAVMLYGADETRPAFTLISDHVWPGVQWVPEVWYAEAASHTQIAAFHADEGALKPVGELIRWAVATSGQIWERILWGLLLVGSVATQEELSAIIGCRRESVTTAMRDFRAQALIEKHDGRIRLTAKGVVHAAQLSALGDDEQLDLALPDPAELPGPVDPNDWN